jgi:hypothetical protein
MLIAWSICFTRFNFLFFPQLTIVFIRYQIVAAFMMMRNLNNKGFRAFSLAIPSARELMQIFEIAAPVFVTMTSKVLF